MRPHLLLVATLLHGLIRCQATSDIPAPPLPQCEFRAAWIATVDNIDWPSKKGLPTADAQRELAAIIDRAADLRLNALVFQVRPSGDAFYRSEREPWSEWLTGEQGKAPDPPWDPLQFLVERAHAQGIEVHAWFNPFRAHHPAGKSPDAPTHLSQRLPEGTVQYGRYRWLDPGDPRVAAWSLAVIADVVARYDIDGVHLDDYFYPYPEKGAVFADDPSYRRYQQNGGKLARDDWRRDNIDRFVADLEQQTHDKKPFVKVGISPFGIARRGVPRGVQSGIDQYAELYADVVKWLRLGQVDYLAPQLYWPIDQQAQSFAVLLPWWIGQNSARHHVWPGLAAGRALQAKAPWREHELAQQIELVRSQSHGPGHLLYSFRALRDDGLAQELREVYADAAPVPPCPWLDPDASPPAAPALQLERAPGSRALVAIAKVAGDARFVCIQALVDGRWLTVGIRGAPQARVGLPAGAVAAAARAIGPVGTIGNAAVETLAR